MNFEFDAEIAELLSDERAVLIFVGGQVEHINDVCREMSEDLDLLGYELEYIAGEEIAETVTSDPDRVGNYEFSNFTLCGQRGHLSVHCSREYIAFLFSPVYGREEREAMRGYRQYIARLAESRDDSQNGETGGSGERFERFIYNDMPISRADIRELRNRRRIEQIKLLERCFDGDPISGDFEDISRLSCRIFEGCAELLSLAEKQIVFRNTNPKALERVFNHDEIERMFTCLLTGALGMCGDAPLEVTVSVSENTLRIDLFSEAESFNDENFSNAMRLPLDPTVFTETGRGLELLLASEIANRYFGQLQFYRKDGVGRLSAFVSPSYYGMGLEFHNAGTIANYMYPQYVIELSELL